MSPSPPRRFGGVRKFAVLGLTSLAAMASIQSTAAADEADHSPCARPQIVKVGHWVQYCPLTRSNVPVYAAPNNSPRKVGSLVHGGSSNWFVGDRYYPHARFTLGSYSNHWWAYTLSDQHTWGWVPEVYFKGGGNNVGDAGLYVCNFGLNYNAC